MTCQTGFSVSLLPLDVPAQRELIFLFDIACLRKRSYIFDIFIFNISAKNSKSWNQNISWWHDMSNRIFSQSSPLDVPAQRELIFLFDIACLRKRSYIIYICIFNISAKNSKSWNQNISWWHDMSNRIFSQSSPLDGPCTTRTHFLVWHSMSPKTILHFWYIYFQLQQKIQNLEIKISHDDVTCQTGFSVSLLH